jgi:hypothetical protein
MNKLIKHLFLCFVVISVAACSSSGGDGDENQTVPAGINAGNAKQLGTAAAEAAKQAVSKNTASGLGLGFRTSADQSVGNISSELSRIYAGRIANAPVAGICIPGSADETVNPDGSTTATFIGCNFLGTGLILDGTVIAFITVAADTITTDLEYFNFTIDDGTNIATLDMQATCTTNVTTTETSCDFSDVVGFDGRIYIFSDATVTGDAFSGYFVSATIIDPDHGSFSIVTSTPILFGCPNDQPLSGQMQFSDAAGVLVTVTFNDCASFTVSYSGTSEVYFW